MTDLDRLLELNFRLRRGEYNPDFEQSRINEFESLKAKIESMMYPEPHGYKIKELESQVAKLKEELKSKQMENTLLINNVYDLQYKESGMETKIEQLKSTLDEIREWFDTPYKQGTIPERIQKLLAKHEGSKVGEQYGKFRAEHPRCEDKK